MKASQSLLPLVAAFCAAPSPWAQTPLHVQYAEAANHNFGQEAAAGLGDVDGDGVDDYVVGARRSANQPGYAKVYSGRTAKELATLTGNGVWFPDVTGGSDRFGATVAGLGDVNGDSVPDVLVGAPEDDLHGVNTGVAQVFSGSDWSLLREHNGSTSGFGVTVAQLGDVDGDGVSEYLIGERQNYVHCYSGATGTVLWTFETHFFDFATNLSPTIGDGNGDGVPDALVGAQAGHVGSTSAPYVAVLDGATGTPNLVVSEGWNTYFGSSVSWIGDVNGDQRSDFAATLPAGLPGDGDLNVYDGATGARLYPLYGTIALDNYVCGLGDQDGDGFGDFAADDEGTAKIFSGATGALIRTLDPTPMGSQNSTGWLASAGDIDGDGLEDLLNPVLASGAAVVFSSSSFAFEDLGFALPGAAGTPTFQGESSMLPGSVYRTELWSPAIAAPALLIAGFDPLFLPFAGGTLVPSLDVVIGNLNTGLTGYVDLWSTFPVGTPSGADLYLQYWIVDAGSPSSLMASNALKATFP